MWFRALLQLLLLNMNAPERLGYTEQECYITKPTTNSNKAIVIGSDIFGYKLINVQLIADIFTEHGYLTIESDLLAPEHQMIYQRLHNQFRCKCLIFQMHHRLA